MYGFFFLHQRQPCPKCPYKHHTSLLLYNKKK
uniref:Uncharacterized protein n=1 Tax=Anguilla anguilla TaxID=7936 RepID=A0A0E9TFU7_ANGAN